MLVVSTCSPPVDHLLAGFFTPGVCVASKPRTKKQIAATNRKIAKTAARKRNIKMAQLALEAKLAKHPGGRPTSFKVEYVEQAYQLTLLGLTLEEIAKIFDVSYACVQQWKIDIPEFADSLKRGGAIADGMVTSSLFQNATGHAGEKIFYNHQSGEIVRAGTRHKPDPVSAIFWLKNRQPHIWRDRHDFTSSDGSFTAFAQAAVEEGKKLEGQLRKEPAAKTNGHGTTDD